MRSFTRFSSLHFHSSQSRASNLRLVSITRLFAQTFAFSHLARAVFPAKTDDGEVGCLRFLSSFNVFSRAITFTLFLRTARPYFSTCRLNFECWPSTNASISLDCLVTTTRRKGRGKIFANFTPFAPFTQRHLDRLRSPSQF